MTRNIAILSVSAAIAIGLAVAGINRLLRHRQEAVSAEPRQKAVPAQVMPATEELDQRFASQVHPFLEHYCFGCHGSKKPKGDFDLTRYSTVSAITADARQWDLLLERLEAQEMPPADAEKKPMAEERAAVVKWIRDFQSHEAQTNSGDPGVVLARRLSNAEFDYTIRDLTGVDIRPTKEFPVDPANEAGFDNSSESLAMSAALLKKYLAAARLVAEHVVFKPEGFVFAPHPVVTDTDRDKYCVTRIIDFYERHQVNYVDYFLAAWRFKHRDALGKRDVSLANFAVDAGLSGKYLSLIYSILEDGHPTVGPIAQIQSQWGEFPADGQREADAKLPAQKLHDLVLLMRRELTPKVDKLQVKGISQGSQPFVLWRNDQIAALHMRCKGEAKGDLAEACQLFCRVFPDAF